MSYVGNARHTQNSRVAPQVQKQQRGKVQKLVHKIINARHFLESWKLSASTEMHWVELHLFLPPPQSVQKVRVVTFQDGWCFGKKVDPQYRISSLSWCYQPLTSLLFIFVAPFMVCPIQDDLWWDSLEPFWTQQGLHFLDSIQGSESLFSLSLMGHRSSSLGFIF